jgi:hypothetical protein
MRAVVRRIAIALSLSQLLACADPATVTVEVTTGQESDAFSRDPAVTKVELIARDANLQAVARATSEPGGAFDLGEVSVDELLSFEVIGSDAAGDVQVRGQSLALVIGALQADVLPVFAQRLMHFSRPPGEMVQGHVAGVGAVLAERYLMLTGGSALSGNDADVIFYDMLALGGSLGGTLSLTARSLVVSADASAVLCIDDSRAVWLDFDSSAAFDATLPAGLGSWAQVAGGRTVVSPGASFVVGATRASGASDRVLVVAPDRSLSLATTSVERAAAAATWIDGTGLVIVGGESSAPSVEVIADGESTAEVLDFPPDDIRGATAVIGTSDGELVVLCGDVPARVFDLGCNSNCTATLPPIDFGAPLGDCHAFALEGGRVLMTGARDDGIISGFSFAIAGGDVSEHPLREPRRGAVTVPAPNGTLAVYGGQLADDSAALSVETLFPE